MPAVNRKRRIVQIGVFCFMLAVPILNLLEIYFIKGSFISLGIGSLGIADPVMILQALIASGSLSGVLVISTLIPILVSFFFGRVWCSWACPYTLILECIEKIPLVAGKMRVKHTKLRADGTLNRAFIVRNLIFLTLLFFVGVCGTPILYLFSPPAVISTQAMLLVKNLTFTAELLFIAALLIVEVFVSYRFVCRYLCPTGSCLSFVKSSARLRVSYSGSCSGCRRCVRVCPMGLDPTKEAEHSLCFNCGECIIACKERSLTWNIGLGK